MPFVMMIAPLEKYPVLLGNHPFFAYFGVKALVLLQPKTRDMRPLPGTRDANETLDWYHTTCSWDPNVYQVEPKSHSETCALWIGICLKA
jgi:hypothetical protein